MTGLVAFSSFYQVNFVVVPNILLVRSMAILNLFGSVVCAPLDETGSSWHFSRDKARKEANLFSPGLGQWNKEAELDSVMWVFQGRDSSGTYSHVSALIHKRIKFLWAHEVLDTRKGKSGRDESNTESVIDYTGCFVRKCEIKYFFPKIFAYFLILHIWKYFYGG